MVPEWKHGAGDGGRDIALSSASVIRLILTERRFLGSSAIALFSNVRDLSGKHWPKVFMQKKLKEIRSLKSVERLSRTNKRNLLCAASDDRLLLLARLVRSTRPILRGRSTLHVPYRSACDSTRPVSRDVRFYTTCIARRLTPNALYRATCDSTRPVSRDVRFYTTCIARRLTPNALYRATCDSTRPVSRDV
ncbi:hypothetical protein RRG08_053058 [Elysia crispata]|uniref:Uncharacterized protein n=1 Tax=Elysia crispata TaxID=231223 RepID=A0AAE0XTV4_9GAST|nr:hypothetical protein RRG08_053058 [Elysia crispata]